MRQAEPWVWLIALALGTCAWAWLLARPRVITRVAYQAALAPPSLATWGRGLLVTFALYVGSAVLVVTAGMDTYVVFAVALVTAWLLDVAGDLRAHREQLAPVAIVHQPQYLGAIEHALARNPALPHYVHSAHVRSVLAFFAPWAPIIVHVPAAHSDDARARLDGVLALPQGTPPVAQISPPR